MRVVPRVLVLSMAAGLLVGAAPAAAQMAGAIEANAGWTGAIDESIIHHAAFGAAVPIALTSRIRVGPEFSYLRGPRRDRDLFFGGTCWFDLLGGHRPVTPYVLFSAGWLHTSFGTYDFTQGAAAGGGGLRIAVSDRLYIAPEARLGTELLIRSTVSVGYRW